MSGAQDSVRRPTGTRPLIGGKKAEKKPFKPSDFGANTLGGAPGLHGRDEGPYGGGALGGSSLGPTSRGLSQGLGGPQDSRGQSTASNQLWDRKDDRIRNRTPGQRATASDRDVTVAEEELEDENSVKDGSYLQDAGASSRTGAKDVSDETVRDTITANGAEDANSRTHGPLGARTGHSG